MSTFEQRLTDAAPMALRAALGWMRDEQEAREVAQEALLKAHRARDRYDPSLPLVPWLRRIVRNTCFDRMARRKHREHPGLDDSLVADGTPTVLDHLEQDESIARVRRGLERVSTSHREILALRHFEELSYEEIGEVLGVPQGTVMSRLYRARKALVRALAEEEE